MVWKKYNGHHGIGDKFPYHKNGDKKKLGGEKEKRCETKKQR